LGCRYLLLVASVLAVARNTLNGLDWEHESIASSTYRFNKSGIFGRVCQGVSQFADRRSQTVINRSIDKGISRPQSPAQFLASDHLTCGFQENGQ
jgi:hypothetical protein